MIAPRPAKIIVRHTTPQDFDGIAALSREVYADAIPWGEVQLVSHLGVFPQGQHVAVEADSGRVVGMAASLIVLWNDYDVNMDWEAFTDRGMFRNHDPAMGRTLYGAEVMVSPQMQRRGVGKKLYQARRELVRSLGLLRIRAGARLRGYHRHARRMSAEAYVIAVVQKKLTDATLSFQLREGFQVIGVVDNYLHHDRESQGHAAIIEWLNPEVARPGDYAGRDPRFAGPVDWLSRVSSG
jgi:GNAT superfamily N-acetyltransferase